MDKRTWASCPRPSVRADVCATARPARCGRARARVCAYHARERLMQLLLPFAIARREKYLTNSL